MMSYKSSNFFLNFVYPPGKPMIHRLRRLKFSSPMTLNKKEYFVLTPVGVITYDHLSFRRDYGKGDREVMGRY